MADSASVVSSTPSGSGRAFKRKRSGNMDSIEGTRNSVEEDNFNEIYKGLKGKLDEQLVVLKMIKHGTLKPKRSSNQLSSPMASISTNKYSMLSIDNWATILYGVDEEFFKYEVCGCTPRHLYASSDVGLATWTQAARFAQ